MPKLNEKEYRCDVCGEVFDFIRNDNWNEDKANEEYKKLFPNESMNDRAVVCDDCWQVVKPEE